MEFTGFLDLIAKYGTWVVFAFLWWMERGERKDAQKDLGELYERALTAMQDGTNAIRELRSIVRGDRG